nr:carbohydrate porin [Candidatus Sodalis endolongispinus]
MKITSSTLIGFGLINFLAISPGIAASKLTVEQRLNQLESRLQQAELRASIAEQKNAQLTRRYNTPSGSRSRLSKLVRIWHSAPAI